MIRGADAVVAGGAGGSPTALGLGLAPGGGVEPTPITCMGANSGLRDFSSSGKSGVGVRDTYDHSCLGATGGTAAGVWRSSKLDCGSAKVLLDREVATETVHMSVRSKVFGASAAQSSEDDPKKLQSFIQVQSILKQLKSHKVRSAFVGGKILKADDPEVVLLSLDIIDELLTPRWVVTVEEREEQAKVAAKHFSLLYEESSQLFKLPHPYILLEDYPYLMWMKAIKKIQRSSYWLQYVHLEEDSKSTERIPKEEVKPAFFASDSDTSGDDGPALTRMRTKSSHKVVFGDRSTAPLGQSSPIRQKLKPSRKEAHHHANHSLETLEISNSSEDEADGHSSDTSFSSQRHRRGYYHKDVVTPQVFDGSGKQTLGNFLNGYERYFRSKYDGTQRECSQELARFLEGDVKKAFNALDGSQRKYRDLKPALLQWFRAQSVGRSHRYQAEFRQLTMKTGETYKLYCMRLEEVANRAFPGDKKECAKQLKKKIMRTTPSSFVRCLEKKEDLKVMLNLGKSITWGEIIQIAERQDRKHFKMQLLEDSEDELPARLDKMKCQVTGVDEELEPVSTKIFQNSQRGRVTSGGPRTCAHCGRLGHMEQNCWRKKGACIICGSAEHGIKNCPKYVPDYQVRCCFECSGPHWRRDCPKRNLNE